MLQQLHVGHSMMLKIWCGVNTFRQLHYLNIVSLKEYGSCQDIINTKIKDGNLLGPYF